MSSPFFLRLSSTFILDPEKLVEKYDVACGIVRAFDWPHTIVESGPRCLLGRWNFLDTVSLPDHEAL